jgi:hypothetical protein
VSDREHCQEPDCGRRGYARGWCAMHYKRWLRTGSPVRGERPTHCAVEGCLRQAKSRGWCHAHYQRWRTHGDVQAHRPIRRAGECEVDGCDRERYARSLCNTHYRRLLQTGDARPEDPIRVVTGEGWLSHGYWYVPVPPHERTLSGGADQIAEHRLVMARRLGRSLRGDEVVHHINGDRTDNRPDNLELWTTAHPRGQRIADKVEFAVEMLRRYAPDLLAEQQPDAADRRRNDAGPRDGSRGPA